MVQAAPTAAAMAKSVTSSTAFGTCGASSGPTPEMTAAASRNWPSMPRFQMPARKTTISPSAMSSRGAMRITVSCQAPSSTPPEMMSR